MEEVKDLQQVVQEPGGKVITEELVSQITPAEVEAVLVRLVAMHQEETLDRGVQEPHHP